MEPEARSERSKHPIKAESAGLGALPKASHPKSTITYHLLDHRKHTTFGASLQHQKMQLPWDSSYRNRQDRPEDFGLERSTSAPPPETTLLVGRNEAIVAPTAFNVRMLGIGGGDKWNDSFAAERETAIDSLFSDSSLTGRVSASQSFEKTPPGFLPKLSGQREVLSSSLRGETDLGMQRLGSMDALERRAIGENLVRSHSAAPSLDVRIPLGPPPGLANCETPQTSNRMSGDSYLGPAMDTSSILQLGQRRPASTGVIGGNQNLSSSVLNSLGLNTGHSGAVRPAAKSLMDLIREDMPPESPFEQGNFDSPSTPRHDVYIERPRTTSPPSQNTRDYIYEESNSRDTGIGGLGGTLGELRINPYHAVEQKHRTPQYGDSHGDRNLSNPMYAPAPQPARPQPQTIHQQARFEQRPQQYQQHSEQQQQQRYQPQQYQPQYQQTQQPGFGGQSPQMQQHIQSHVLPNGQTVYLNAPPPHYGYTTVQYHPHSQQHHIVHQVPSGIAPNGEQYISVVPVHGGGPVPVGQNGAYAYIQTERQPGTPQAYTIVSPNSPGGHAGAVKQSRNVGVADTQRPRGREKGKGRKGGSGKRNEQKHQQNSTYSPLLEDFKAKKNRNWTALDIKGHVVEFCQDQNGSRFIQQRLEVGNLAEKEVVMVEVLPAIRRLRNDVFGNYVVQKLLEHGSPKMKSDIKDTLQGEMLELSLQMYGCRVVQKALETLDDSDLPKLIGEFHNNVLSCIYDQNGNHVMQKCIEVMSGKAKEARAAGEESRASFCEDQIEFIVSDVLGDVKMLSCHPYGCRVLQRILEHCEEPNRSKALDEIKKCHRVLLDDQYGNYVIQHILQFGRESDRDSLLEIVLANGVLKLSRQKFASNVVEKLLKYGTPRQRTAIVKEMLKYVDDRSGLQVSEGAEGICAVLLMVRDAYANYVVQTTLDVVAEGEEKTKLMKELNAHSEELKNYTFAKHIVTKLGA